MFKGFKPVAIAMLALAAGAAGATTIGFNDLSKKSFTNSYQEDGYSLTSASANMIATGSPKALETTGFTFASVSGQAFDLNSFDLDFFDADTLTLSYTFADGTTGTTTLNDKNSDHYKFDLDDLASFSLSGTVNAGTKRKPVIDAADFLVDTIKVADYVAPTAVPEPGSLALMLAGVAVLGTVARRRRA